MLNPAALPLGLPHIKSNKLDLILWYKKHLDNIVTFVYNCYRAYKKGGTTYE